MAAKVPKGMISNAGILCCDPHKRGSCLPFGCGGLIYAAMNSMMNIPTAFYDPKGVQAPGSVKCGDERLR